VRDQDRRVDLAFLLEGEGELPGARKRRWTIDTAIKPAESKAHDLANQSVVSPRFGGVPLAFREHQLEQCPQGSFRLALYVLPIRNVAAGKEQALKNRQEALPGESQQALRNGLKCRSAILARSVSGCDGFCVQFASDDMKSDILS
jgi:hypothetical protein